MLGVAYVIRVVGYSMKTATDTFSEIQNKPVNIQNKMPYQNSAAKSVTIFYFRM